MLPEGSLGVKYASGEDAPPSLDDGSAVIASNRAERKRVQVRAEAKRRRDSRRPPMNRKRADATAAQTIMGAHRKKQRCSSVQERGGNRLPLTALHPYEGTRPALFKAAKW